jgi:hypothetical protein
VGSSEGDPSNFCAAWGGEGGAGSSNAYHIVITTNGALN